MDYSASFLARYGPDRRVEWTIFLLNSIPDCPKDDLLVIGPRYEPECSMARGLGWPKRGVRGLDTFSYSPAIDVGDMHRLPYADESFSAIICSWTLSYSSQPKVACAEMQRVLRPGGYLVVSIQKVGEDYRTYSPVSFREPIASRRSPSSTSCTTVSVASPVSSRCSVRRTTATPSPPFERP